MDRMLAHLAKLGLTDVVLTTYNFAMRSVDTAIVCMTNHDDRLTLAQDMLA